MTTIRLESASDAPGIRRVNEEAFGQATEADLVDEIRLSCPDCLSLVAEDDTIVGHVLFSPAIVETPGKTVVGMGLAPMSVLSDRQGQGIGTELVETAVAILRERGCPFVIVLGQADV